MSLIHLSRIHNNVDHYMKDLDLLYSHWNTEDGVLVRLIRSDRPDYFIEGRLPVEALDQLTPLPSFDRAI